MMSFNNHIHPTQSIFFAHSEPAAGMTEGVERNSLFSRLSSYSKALLLAAGFVIGGVQAWAQAPVLEATQTHTYNYETRITLYTTKAGLHRFTLAPEDKSKTKRSHWPIIFIDYENNNKFIREMINLTEEREFEVNVPAVNGTITITGEDGVWKLVATSQSLRSMPAYTGTEMRYINVNDNLIGNGNYGLNASTFPKLETIYAERNLLSGQLNMVVPSSSYNFDYLRRVSFMENRLNDALLTNLKNATYINLSKNLLSKITPPPTMNPGTTKVFKGGNAHTYTNNPAALYEDVTENDVKFDLTVNRLNIATLPRMPKSTVTAKPMLPANFLYTLQARYNLSPNQYALRTGLIDLTSQATAYGILDSSKPTKYRFFIENDAATDNYTEIPTNYYEQVEPGKFRFLRGVGAQAKIFAAMTTEAFPNPLESYELGTVPSTYPEWGYTGVLKQPEGTPSADRNTYKNNLAANTIGDGETRELAKRFYRTNTFTLDSRNQNYWYGFEDNDWSKPINWTGGFVPPTLPSDGGTQDVEFATTQNYSSSAIRDLHTDQNRSVRIMVNRSETGKAVVVNPGHYLRLEQLRTAPAVTGPHKNSNDLSYRTVVRAEPGKANGSILVRGAAMVSSSSSSNSYSNYGTSPHYTPVTIEMYSKAFDGNRDKQNATWQYFGLPFYEEANPSDLFGETTWIRKYVRDKQNDADEKWEELAVGEKIKHGTAYEISQPTPTLYRLTGRLNQRDAHVYQLSSVPSPSNYNDMNILANPFAIPVPIDASKMNWPDNVAERTIYLYNTGSRRNWDANNGGTVNSNTNPGAYTVGIPIDLANQVAGMPKFIPSLSAFLVKSKKVPYAMGALTLRQNESMLATPTEENRSSEFLPSIWMTVESEETSDQMWLVETDKATDGHDDGYDSEKILTAGQVQLYALESKNYQVSSRPEIKHAELAFVAGDDAGQYVLNVQLDDRLASRQYYLVDHLTGESHALYDGMRYRFSAKANDAQQRFAITTEPTKVQEVKSQGYDIYVDAQRSVHVRNHTDEAADVKVYDAAGKQVAHFSVAARTDGTEALFAPGVYVISVTNAQAQVTQRYVVH